MSGYGCVDWNENVSSDGGAKWTVGDWTGDGTIDTSIIGDETGSSCDCCGCGSGGN